ncbi:hypothetical protein [Microbacterium marinilacus]|uniref:Uncharacterized protein n=1 Tax=Microbacterium marinilacus TaxID=415209 RepID=A0ABP7BVD5_9MICO|nr:hypothetical protein [Microbacterium marinilacus]MBY0688068.1 hypothetical protein [Microbacterium marinilacus]
MRIAARRIARLALAAAAVSATLALAGCGGGLSAHAGTPFTACLRDAGVDLSRMGTWSRDEERDALSDTRALECVLSDLPAEQRRDVLGWAFPEVAPDAPAEAQAAVADAVWGFLVERESADPATVTDAGALLVALGMTGPDPSGVRHALSLQPHLDAAGPLYEAWRDTESSADDTTTRARFVDEQLAAGGALAEFFTETSDALLAAQEAADPRDEGRGAETRPGGDDHDG